MCWIYKKKIDQPVDRSTAQQMAQFDTEVKFHHSFPFPLKHIENLIDVQANDTSK